MHEEWQQQRGELNHDWLKNSFMKSVDAFAARLGQQQPDHERIQEFLSADLPVWERRRRELRALLENAESALSPMQLFHVPPLSQCAAEVMIWLPGLVHALWLNRCPIRRLIEEAGQAVERADSLYAHAVRELGEPVASADLGRLKNARGAIREFSAALRVLSAAISALPHKILVM